MSIWSIFLYIFNWLHYLPPVLSYCGLHIFEFLICVKVLLSQCASLNGFPRKDPIFQSPHTWIAAWQAQNSREGHLTFSTIFRITVRLCALESAIPIMTSQGCMFSKATFQHTGVSCYITKSTYWDTFSRRKGRNSKEGLPFSNPHKAPDGLAKFWWSSEISEKSETNSVFIPM